MPVIYTQPIGENTVYLTDGNEDEFAVWNRDREKYLPHLDWFSDALTITHYESSVTILVVSSNIDFFEINFTKTKEDSTQLQAELTISVHSIYQEQGDMVWALTHAHMEDLIRFMKRYYQAFFHDVKRMEVVVDYEDTVQQRYQQVFDQLLHAIPVL